MHRYRWHWPPARPEAEAALARRLGVSPVVARVLVGRGLDTPERVEEFLADPPHDRCDPMLLQDMEVAARRLLAAVEEGESIAVYGDYDVDGQCATALLVSFLRRMGARVTFYVPHRLQEGYGLHASALRALRERGAQVVVTVDCGVTASEAAAEAARLGLDLIITDHHKVPARLPSAVAVVDPGRPDCRYPFKELAGVGVAYKLAQAVWRLAGEPAEADPARFLDLVALGTVADVMPLTGENRALVRDGLALLNAEPRPGLRALIAAAGLEQVTAGHLGFILGPRLNAVGRLQDPAAGVRLLLTTAETEAAELAAELDRLNRMRQGLEGFIVDQARRQVERVDLAQTPAIVVWGEGWHPGVLGIVASRLVEAYYRPTLVIGTEGAAARGSGRGVANFDLYGALSRCEELFDAFGGHAAAAGFSLPASRIPALRDAFIAAAREQLGVRLAAGELVPEIRVDAEVRLEELHEGIPQELERLGPFGAGNPAPLLGHRCLLVTAARPVGSGGKHLQITFREDGGREVRGIAFGVGEEADAYRPGTYVRVAFAPRRDVWQGREEVRLHVRLMEVAVRPRPVVATVPSQRRWPSRVAIDDRREGTPAFREGLVHKALLAEELSSQRGPVVLFVLDDEEHREASRLVASTTVRIEPVFDGRNFVAPVRLESALRPEGEGDEGEELQVVLACLPPVSSCLAEFLASVPGRIRLHLAFSRQDAERARRLLHVRYPSRQDLVRYYRVWRRLLAGGRSDADDGDIPPLARESVINIFREIGLMRRHLDRWVLTPPPPGQKLELQASPTYARGQALREAFERWARVALTADPEAVALALCDPQPAEGVAS